jgi:hypothetical protein
MRLATSLLRLFGLLVFAAGSGVALRADLVMRPDGRILFQPQLTWANSESTLQGTGYLIEHEGKIYGVTSIHFLNFDAGGLKAANWLDVYAETPVATFRVSYGRPARSAITLMRHAADDFLLMPGGALPENTTALKLESVARYEPGTRLWFPNKNRDVEIGHTWIDATVVEDAGAWIEVRLGEKITVQSQSGSPVLNAATGKVVGMVQGAEEQQGRTVLFLCPARGLVKFLGRKQRLYPLTTSISRKR